MQTLRELYGSYTYNGDPLADDMGGEGGRVHDWRSYVPDELEAMWPTLSPEVRMAVAVVAQIAASNEEWD